jgi:hypothetical protein
VERGAWSVERGAWSVERGTWNMVLRSRSEPVTSTVVHDMMNTDRSAWTVATVGSYFVTVTVTGRDKARLTFQSAL